MEFFVLQTLAVVSYVPLPAQHNTCSVLCFARSNLIHEFKVWRFKFILMEICNAMNFWMVRMLTVEGILSFWNLLGTMCISAILRTCRIVYYNIGSSLREQLETNLQIYHSLQKINEFYGYARVQVQPLSSVVSFAKLSHTVSHLNSGTVEEIVNSPIDRWVRSLASAISQFEWGYCLTGIIIMPVYAWNSPSEIAIPSSYCKYQWQNWHKCI